MQRGAFDRNSWDPVNVRKCPHGGIEGVLSQEDCEVRQEYAN
jgi:hypothetical protein